MHAYLLSLLNTKKADITDSMQPLHGGGSSLTSTPTYGSVPSTPPAPPIKYTDNRSFSSYMNEYDEYYRDGWARFGNWTIGRFLPKPPGQSEYFKTIKHTDPWMEGLANAQGVVSGLSLLAPLLLGKRLAATAGLRAGFGYGSSAVPVAATAGAAAATPQGQQAIQRVSTSLPWINRIPNWLFSYNSSYPNLVDRTFNSLPGMTQRLGTQVPRLQPSIDRLSRFVSATPPSIRQIPQTMTSGSYEFMKDILIPGSSFRHINYDAPVNSLRSATSQLLGLGTSTAFSGFAFDNIARTAEAAREVEDRTGAGIPNLTNNLLSNLMISPTPRVLMPFFLADQAKTKIFPDRISPVTALDMQSTDPDRLEQGTENFVREARGNGVIGSSLQAIDDYAVFNPFMFQDANHAIFSDMHGYMSQNFNENFSLGGLHKHLVNSQGWSPAKASGLPLIAEVSNWFSSHLNTLQQANEFEANILSRNPKNLKPAETAERMRLIDHRKNLIADNLNIAQSYYSHAAAMTAMNDSEFNEAYLVPQRSQIISNLFDTMFKNAPEGVEADSDLQSMRDLQINLESMSLANPNPADFRRALEETPFETEEGVVSYYDVLNSFNRSYAARVLGGEDGIRTKSVLNGIRSRIYELERSGKPGELQYFKENIATPLLTLAAQPLTTQEFAEELASRTTEDNTSLYNEVLAISPDVFRSGMDDMMTQLLRNRNNYQNIYMTEAAADLQNRIRYFHHNAEQAPVVEAPIDPKPNSYLNFTM